MSKEDFKMLVQNSAQAGSDAQRLEAMANDAVVERNLTEQLLAEAVG